MKKLRKALVVGVMGMTVLTMSVVAAPKAGAVAQAGDLIKMDGLSSVYYLGADNKRYVFPNEKTYFSWYSDFSNVVTVPQSELESYPLGANVTVRPGTKLVKITTDPKVYAVEPGGTLLWVPSEAVAKTLYGDMWAKRVIDVPDGFFTNYTVASGQATADAYPAGSLVMFGDDATVYYIDASGNARPIADEAAFLANRFKWDDILKATIDMPAEGSPITGAEADLTDTSEGAGGIPGAGTGLTVALAGDTPASRNIPSNSTLVPFTVVNFTASNDGNVTVRNVTFTRSGTGDPADFDGGYLFLGNERLTTKRTVNTSDNTITFTAVNLMIPAGMTKEVSLLMNIGSTKTGNHYFEIAKASDVTTDGASVSGSFPVAGNTMALASVDAATVTVTGQANNSTAKIGETNVVLSDFDIRNDDREIVNIYRIRLKQEGTAGDSSIKNLSLDLDGNIVSSGVSMVNKYVDFVLDTPLQLKKSQTISATVRGDVVDDIGKTVQFYLNNIADIDARGTAYGTFYSATISSSFGSGTGSSIEIAGSEINVAFDGPQAEDVKDNTDNVNFANFKIKSNNLDVNIDNLRLTITNGAANNHPLENVEMVDTGNNVSYSTSDTPASTTGATTVNFENLYLESGVQYNFQIQGDIPDLETPGATFVVSMNLANGNGFTANFQDSDETAIADSDLSSLSLTGKTMTVAAPAYTLATVTTNANTVVKDASGVLLFKGKVTANNVDDLKMSKLTIDGTFGYDYDFSDSFSRIYLYKVNSDNTETKLDDETSLAKASFAFTGFTLNIPKGVSNGVYIVVRGDVKDNPTSGATTTVGYNASASNFIVKDSDNNSVSPTSISATDGGMITVATKGSYTMVMDTELSGINNDKNVLAGSMPLLGRVKLTAAKEAAIVEDLVIYNAGDATNATLGRLYLYDNKDMTGTALGSADMNADAHPKALFDSINVEVPTSGSTYLYIFGMVKSIDYSSSPSSDATAAAGKTILLNVPDDAAGYTTKVTGSDTGEVLVATAGGPNATGNTKTSYVYGAIVSNITTAFANATLQTGTAKDIFSFKVTVPSSGNIDIDGDPLGVKLATTTFSVATSGSFSLADFLVYRVGGSNDEQAAKYGGTTATAMDFSDNTFTVNFLDTYGATEADLTIRPGDTAEYVIRATVDGTVEANNTLQVTLETIDTNVDYVHETGTAGVDTAVIHPRLTGISSVRGGSLTK